MPTHTRLKGVSSVFDSQLSDQLEANLVGFFQWGFLGVGGFFNVTVPQSGVYGGKESRLRPVYDPNYTDGQVWEAFRKDWVWETGVEYDHQPIRVSGVYVDGVFHAVNETGAYAHHIDYPNGRVVFDNPISTGCVVEAEYSYRLFQLYTADTEWWQKIQTRSFRVDDPHFLQWGSGEWDILAQNRVQLPAIIVEAVPNVASRQGFEIGNSVQTVQQDVLFHVLAEDRFYFKWLHDTITNQKDKRFIGFDKNRMLAADAFPLNQDGSPRESGMMYPDLVKPSGEGGYGWRQLRVEDSRSTEQPRLGSVHYCTVRLRIGIDLP